MSRQSVAGQFIKNGLSLGHGSLNLTDNLSLLESRVVIAGVSAYRSRDDETERSTFDKTSQCAGRHSRENVCQPGSDIGNGRVGLIVF